MNITTENQYNEILFYKLKLFLHEELAKIMGYLLYLTFGIFFPISML